MTPASVLQVTASTATRRFRIAPVLTVVQLAASLALFVGALMLMATVRNLLIQDLGFEPRQVTVFPLRPPVGLPPEAARTHVDEFRARLAASPGVSGVVLAAGAPFAGGANLRAMVRAEGVEPFSETLVQEVYAPGYFDVLRIPLVRGRPFDANDMATTGSDATVTSAILSESLARALFGTVDVVGRAVEMPRYQQAPRTLQIVGVAAEARYASLTEPAPPIIYLTGTVERAPNLTVIARTNTDVALTGTIDAIARSLRTPAPAQIQTLDDAIPRARGEWDVLAGLLVALAAIASVVAAVGVYGVVAFAAASRRAEFGIRMALGASAVAVRGQVLRTAAAMTAAGLIFGLAGASALMQVLRARLFGVSPMGPLVWGIASLLLVAIVVLASLPPARQAARVSLADTLRAM